MNKIPKHLEPYLNGDLVSYRIFDIGTKEYPKGHYQIHDKTLHHVGFADTIEMAQLIVEAINMLFKVRTVE